MIPLNKYFYLNIQPELTNLELEFINELEKLTSLWFSKNDKLAVFITKDSNTVMEFLNEIKTDNYEVFLLQFLQKYPTIKEEVLEIAFNYPNLYLSSKIEKCYVKNQYKIYYDNGLIENQIFKLIHLFNENGLLKKLLQHQFPTHTFNCIIEDTNRDRTLMIENDFLYNALLGSNGYYTKNHIIQSSSYDKITETVSNFLLHKMLDKKVKNKVSIKIKKKI